MNENEVNENELNTNENIDKNKDENQQEMTLDKHNTKSFLKSGALGLFIGLAVIVPGISGATISIIFKLYDKLLYAVSTILKQFKKSFMWLLPIGIGLIIGFIAGFFGVKYALEFIPFALVCLFAGLMIGSFPSVNDEIKHEKKTPLRIVLFFIGLIIPILLSVLITLFSSSSTYKFMPINWWEYLVFPFMGFVIAITQVVPGLSASAFLMMVGYYTSIMEAISFKTYQDHATIASNPMIIVLLVLMVIGFLVGFFFTSKAINYMFKKNRATTFFPIVGLSIGSIVTMFFNPEIYSTYQSWYNNTLGEKQVSMGLDIGLGMALLIIGIMVSLGLYIYQRKHDKAISTLEK